MEGTRLVMEGTRLVTEGNKVSYGGHKVSYRGHTGNTTEHGIRMQGCRAAMGAHIWRTQDK